MIQVGNLLEVVFPENNIRVISVNENYDSLTYVDDESILLRSFLNDYYLKECSKKSKSISLRRSKTVSMSSHGYYGYQKTLDRKMIPNQETSIIVKKIFEMYLQNISSSVIAKYLTDNMVETPAYYKMKTSNSKCYNITEDKYYKWKRVQVNRILSNYYYTGNTVNLKTIIIKGKEKTNPNPVILENTHQAIITLEQYNKVKEIKQKKVTYEKTNKDDVRIRGLFKCECGRKLTYEKTPKSSKYRCKHCLKYFNAPMLHTALSGDIKNLINRYTKNSISFETRLKALLNNSSDMLNKNELEKEKNFIQDKLGQLIESNIEGSISKQYYKTKSTELKETLSLLNSELSKYDDLNIGISMFDTRLNQLKMDITKSVDISNDLELIRHFIKECSVIVSNDVIKLKTKYKCELKIS